MMLKTNIIGSIIVCAILFGVIGYFLSLGIDINWILYFKVLGIIAAISVIASIASLGKSSN